MAVPTIEVTVVYKKEDKTYKVLVEAGSTLQEIVEAVKKDNSNSPDCGRTWTPYILENSNRRVLRWQYRVPHRMKIYILSR